MSVKWRWGVGAGFKKRCQCLKSEKIITAIIFLWVCTHWAMNSVSATTSYRWWGKSKISNFTKDGLAWLAQSCDIEVPSEVSVENSASQHLGPFCAQSPLFRSNLSPLWPHHMSISCFLLPTYPTPRALPSAFSVPSPGASGPTIFQVSSLKAKGGEVRLSLAILPPDCSIQSYPVSQHGAPVSSTFRHRQCPCHHV